MFTLLPYVDYYTCKQECELTKADLNLVPSCAVGETAAVAPRAVAYLSATPWWWTADPTSLPEAPSLPGTWRDSGGKYCMESCQAALYKLRR